MYQSTWLECPFYFIVFIYDIFLEASVMQDNKTSTVVSLKKTYITFFANLPKMLHALEEWYFMLLSRARE